jgi:hypothetical protein
MVREMPAVVFGPKIQHGVQSETTWTRQKDRPFTKRKRAVSGKGSVRDTDFNPFLETSPKVVCTDVKAPDSYSEL